MGMNIYSYMAYGIYFSAEDIDYVEFTEQILPEGLEWMPVGDQGSDALGTILAVQDSYLSLSDFVGHRYPESGDQLGWNVQLGNALIGLNFGFEEIIPKKLSARWHIAGWVG